MPQAVFDVRRAIVRVCVETGGGGRNFGSGIHLGDGLVLTAAHVVQGGKTFSAVALRQNAYGRATLLAVDQRLDIALLRLSDPPTTSAALATAVPPIGSRVISAGFGGDRKLKFNFGNVESFTGRGQSTGMFWSGSARSGDSGGPVFNRNGLVVGILLGVSANGRSTHGTHVGELAAFCRPWFRRPAAGQRPVKAPGAETVTAPGAELAALRSELVALRAEIAALKVARGPAGPAGKNGKDGRDATAQEIDYDTIADLIAEQIAGEMTIRISPKR